MTVPIKAHETAAVVVVSESAAAADCSSHLFISQNLSLRVVKLRLTLLFWKWLREMEEELEKREAQTERLNLAAC